jgi:hypothetical protein
VRDPDAVGLKTTLAEQLAAAARLAPHVLVDMAKSPAFVPPMVMPLMVIDDLVPLLSVADCAALVEPTAVFGKPALVGDTVTLPEDAVAPVPDNATVCGLFVAESAIVNVAAREPVVVGLNAIETEQLVDAARLLPQVLLEIEKSPELVPVSEMLLIVIDELLPLVKVVDWVPLLEPTLIVPNDRVVGLLLTLPVEPPVPNPVSVTF